jgi:hypothetical protein
MDASIARLAGKQFGVVGTAQLEELGISRAAVRTIDGAGGSSGQPRACWPLPDRRRRGSGI